MISTSMISFDKDFTKKKDSDRLWLHFDFGLIDKSHHVEAWGESSSHKTSSFRQYKIFLSSLDTIILIT